MIVPSALYRLRAAGIIRVNILGGPASPIKWRLFANDLHPSPSSQLADFVEASFPGYEEVHNKTWNAPIVSGDEVHTIGTDYYLWFPIGASSGLLYGWYSVFVGDGGPYHLLAERFPSPINLDDGQLIGVLPVVTERDQP